MKKLYLIIITILIGMQVNLFAQDGGVSIGKGDVDADPSAILELVSTNKGLLIPRLSSTQREGISSPASGLLVYDTTLTGFYYWTGSSWKAISGINSSSGTILPGSGGEGDLFYNTTEGVLYTYIENIWNPVGGNKQILSLNNTTLKLLEEGKENGSEVDLSVLFQDLSLVGTTLSISDGNSVDLGIITGTGQTLSLDGAILTIANGNNVDFSSLLGMYMKKSIYDTDNNGQIDNADKVNGLTVETPVPAEAVFTDSQQLTLTGNKLELERGGSVTLPSGGGGTDSQTLSISGDTLSITGGNSVLLPNGNGTGDMTKVVYDTNGNSKVDEAENAATVNNKTVETSVPTGAVFTDDQNLSEVLSSGNSAAGSKITSLGSPTVSTDAATKGYVDNSISGFESTSQKNIAGGYVGLDSNTKIDPNYLPSGVNLGTVYTAANATEEAGLSLVAGDVVVRTDESKTYMYDGSALVELQNPTGAVTSVNGDIGVITLDKSDVGLNNVDNTSDVNKPVSTATQSALDLKANTSDLGTAASEDVGTGAGNVVQLDGSGRLPSVDGSQLTNLPAAPVTSVNSQTGDITLDKSDVGLGNVDNTSDLNKPVSTATQDSLNLKEDKTNKNVAGGYVGLELDGKINSNYLPSGVNLGTVYTAANATEEAGLSLVAGDVVVRTDESKTYMYDGSALVELQNPTGAVTSVNGQTGVVSLTTAEVSSSTDKNYVTDAQAVVLGNTSGINTGDQDISGIATNAADIAANTNNITTNTNAIAGLGTASGEDVGTGAGNVVQLDGSGKLPAVDGSQLTNLPSSPVTSVNGETGDVSLSSSEIGYDNATSGLNSTDVKSALDELATGAAGGDMTKVVYDTNGNSKVDEAENAATVNNKTVETSVPTGAVFTDDQNLSEVLSSGNSAAGSKITSLGSPTVSTDAATKGYVDNSISGFESTSQKNIAGGYVGLDSNTKIDPNYLPSGVNLGTVYTAANATEEAGLSLVAGDVVVRTDESKTYMYDGSALVELQNPTGAVTSVNGDIGVITLDKSDVGLNNVDNTSDVNKPVSTATQSALDLKANTSDLGTAASEDVGTGAGNVVQLDGSGRLPSVDGSQLTNLPAAPVTSVNSQTGDITLDKSDVGLGNVDNTSDLNKPVSTATQDSLNLKEDKTNKNVAGGYVGLELDGKINSNYLPSGVNLGTVYTAANATEEAGLSLVAGDVVVRTDESKTYMYDGSALVELQNPTGAVTSVNGQTGVVSLTTAEVSSSTDKNYVTDAQAVVLGNTSGINTGDQDISGIATNAADIAANTNNITTNTNAIAGLGTASGEDVGTGAGNVVQLDGSGKLPAVDGSQLTNLPSSPVTSVNGETGDVSLSSSEIGYDNATSGLNSTDVKSALDELATGAAGGDMTKVVYDTNGNSKVDEAENAATVNNKTVETSVPTGAVFTDDQNLSEVLSSGNSAAGSKITSLGSPTVSTDAATKGYVDNSISGFESTSQKNIAGGYVGLDSNTKIDPNYLPSGVNLGTVYTAANATEEAGLSLVAGDVVVRTDESKTYMYDGSALVELQNPTGAVTSVNGDIGVITLDKSDVGLNNVDNTSDVNKPVSTATQSALDLKANTSDLGTAASEDVGTGAGNVVQLDGSGRLPSVDGSQLTNLPAAPVTSVNSQTGDITLDKSDVGLGNVDNTSDLNKPVSTATQDSLNLKEDKTNKNVAGGYVGLELDGKINSNYLPSGVNLGTVYTAANATEEAGLSLVAGDVVVRTDESKTYMYDGSALVELQNPTGAVTSVNGQTGVVSLTTAEVSSSTDKNYVTDAQAVVLGNTSGINTGDQDISGIATNAADIAANTNNITTNTNAIAGLGTASGEDVGTGAGNVVQLDGSGKLPAVDGSQLTNLPSSPVTSVNGETGDVSLSSSEIGYDNATSGLNSTDVKSALDELATGAAGGDMTKVVYDTNGNSKVDEAENAATVNNKTVETSVPTGAVFTDDQNLSEVLSSGNSAAGSKITSLGSPTVSTDAATKGYVDNSISGFESTSQKNIAGGYVGLDSNTKIDPNYLPSGVNLGTVYTAANATEEAGLSLVAGDVVVRTDESKTYMYDGSALVELQNPTGAVTSVNGDIGVITLDKSDVGLNNVDNTSDVNKPVSTATQSALDLKANTSDLGTAASEDVGTGAGNVVQLDGSGRLPSVDGSQLTNLPAAPVTSVNSQTGDITLDKSDVGLGNVDNTSDLNKPVSTATQDSLNLKEDKTNKNVAGGYVGLELDGKINSNYLPSGVNLGTVYTAANATEEAGLSLVAGDVVVRTDESKTYMYDGSALVELQNPTGAVTSVNGQTGVVSLTTAEVSSSTDKNYVTDAQAVVLGNTSGINTGDQDISGIATNAADIAANTNNITTNTNAIAGLGTASGEDVGTGAGNVVQLDGSGKLPAVDGSQLTNLPSSPVTSVNGETGDVSLSSSEIGYDNATSGLNSTDVKSALDELATGAAGGDMTKVVYDTNGNSKVDEAENAATVNNKTVETSVPTGAVFTDDQNLSEVLSSGNSAAGSKITSLGSPTVSTDAATKGYVDNSISGFESTSQKNIAGGYVGLDSNTKIDPNYLPSGVNLGTVYTAANATEEAGLSLVAGDVVVRTDESKTYMYDGSALVELQNPTGAVTSVNGDIGVITLDKSDVGLNNVDNTSDVNKPVSTATQSALDLKANTSDLGTAASEDVGTGAGNVVQLDGSGRLPSVDGSQLTNLPAAPVTSVNSQTGDITLDKSDVGLGNVDNTSDLNKPVSTATQDSLNLKEDKTNKNVAGGYVGLELDGKINSNYLPSGVNLGTVYTAANATEEAGLSLVAGDVVVRTDESKTYMYDGSALVELQNPTGAVTSVNGQTGVVSLTTAEVSSSTDKNYVTDAQAVVLGNTSGINTGDQDISGIATNAADIAANTNNITTNTNAIAGLGTASGEDVGTGAGNVVQLDGSGKLPAVDGSQLTNLPSSPVTSVNGETGDVSLSSSEIGYDNATSGLNSTDVKSALDELATGAAGGDMTKVVYDTNGNSKVDEAENAATVNNKTVETSVPTGAVFTDDQNLSEVLSSGNSAAGSKITSLGSPTVSTDAATKGYVDNSISGFESTSQKNIAGGYVGLDSNTKIDPNYLPSGVNLGTVYTAANATEEAGLSLVAGDVVVRTDESKTYMYDGSALVELQNPTGAVTSVNGDIGVITLDKSDVGLNNVDNTSDVNKPVSTATQSALDLKANTSDLGTAASEDVGTGAGNVVQLDGSGRLPSVDGSQLTNLPAAPVTSVNSQTGDITLDKSDVGLGNVDNTSDLNKPVSTATQDSLNLKEDKTNKNVAGGYVGLELDGKINSNYLPSGVNLGTVYTAANATEEAGLSLVAGDVVVRTDESKTYMYDGSALVELQNPTGAVTSVNGQTGVVSLTTAEVSSSTDKNYVTDAQAVVLGNTSGINTGDQDISGIATNAADIAANNR